MSYLWSLLETLLQKGDMKCKDWANYYWADVRKYKSLVLQFKVDLEQQAAEEQGQIVVNRNHLHFGSIDWKREQMSKCEAKVKKYERLAGWCENLAYKLKVVTRKIGVREFAYESSLSILLSDLEQRYFLYKRGHMNSKKWGHRIFKSRYKSEPNYCRENARKFKATAREIRRRRRLLGVLQLFHRSARFLPSERLDAVDYSTVFHWVFDHVVSSTSSYLDLLESDFAPLCMELFVEI
jgi:hypothetical protein